MPIWKLTPTDTNALQWQVSKYLGEVVVRAESEHRARELVGYCCWQTGQSSNANIAGPPWNNPKVVSAVRCNDSEFAAYGSDEQVLSPPEMVDLWKEFSS
jgi:hypothetical protein